MKQPMPALALIAMAIATLPFCQTYTPREQEILNFPRDRAVDYEQYLVKQDQYTTRGNLYHQKYRDHLIGIARISSEKYRLRVMKNSIGFYHDKKSRDAGKLFLGVDFLVEPDADTADYRYGNMVGHLLRKHLTDFLYITQSCGTLFGEKEIVGSVIGMRWDDGGKNQLFNFWIDAKDAELYERHRITLAELIERNTITNAEGQVIRLRK
jgi:hypothetical protein